MKRSVVLLLGSAILSLAAVACSGGSSNQLPAPLRPAVDAIAPAMTLSTDAVRPDGTIAAPTAPPAASGYTNVPPVTPKGTTCRTGETYNIGVTSGPTNISPAGATETFTVFEPDKLCGGKTYPLIFNGPGFGGSRTSTAGSFEQFTGAGYGVISVDEAGEGNDGGKIRVMDPDQEGVMLLSVMNWAQAKLTWLAYGPTLDGKDSHEPIYGTDGGSYGGMYQFMLLNVDKRHRLRAIVPQITPHDLNFSLYPGGVIKSLWDVALFGDGQSAGSGASRANFDPFVDDTFVSGELTNGEDSYTHDFFGYHSAGYFCDDTAIATNGGAGTHPDLAPTSETPKINALVWIGVRDTLFDFNNGYNNYKCLQRAGGDVRLLSYQAGHNSQVESNVNGAGVVPDPYVALFYPNNDSLDTRCGSLAESDAELAWFNKYLKGETTAEFDKIPKDPCISFESGDGISIPAVPQYSVTPSDYKSYNIGSNAIVSGNPNQLPTAVTVYTAPSTGAVEAGIPHISFDVSPTLGATTGTPIVFVGIGIKHVASKLSSVWDLMDNQVMPLRGTGHFNIDLIGGGTRLQPGDQLSVLIFGSNSQFVTNGNEGAQSATGIQALTITGNVYLPIFGDIKDNV